jgi:LacI family transcriptional regulator
VFADALNEAEGERCATELLAANVRFTALACANDRLAVGAVAALRQRGLSCPHDISVTGYNDMALVDRLSPPLTTIRIQQYRAGYEAGELLLSALQTDPGERRPRHLVLPVDLIVRDSTRALAGASAEAV